MSDDIHESGPSGWAWFQLGRMAAKADRSRSEAVSAVFAARRQRHVVADPLLAQNQALAAENARLKEDLAAYKYNYANLRTWAEEAVRDLRHLRGETND
jgi:hypothetical protein